MNSCFERKKCGEINKLVKFIDISIQCKAFMNKTTVDAIDMSRAIKVYKENSNS